MEPSLQVVGQWLAAFTAAVGFLRWAKVKAFDPARKMLQRLGSALDLVERELGNGGKSMKDKVTRIDRMTARVDARQIALMAALPEPMFWTDPKGEFEMVNRAMEDLTGFSRAHLMGMEWVSAVHSLDQVRVVKEWQGPDDGAVKHQRAWLTSCRLLTPSGRILLVRIEAHPIRESFGDHLLVGWHGVLTAEDRA
ncbi:MAG: PAS domain-containing protein [Acidobacteriota bacterium]|nr:PAS domain-containing protein [Acidobacteriota bacterium]